MALRYLWILNGFKTQHFMFLLASSYNLHYLLSEAIAWEVLWHQLQGTSKLSSSFHFEIITIDVSRSMRLWLIVRRFHIPLATMIYNQGINLFLLYCSISPIINCFISSYSNNDDKILTMNSIIQIWRRFISYMLIYPRREKKDNFRLHWQRINCHYTSYFYWLYIQSASIWKQKLCVSLM